MKKWRIPMNLQTFADGSGAEGGSGSEGNGAGDNNGAGLGAGEGTMTLDDFLKKDGMQAEFDRRVSKALDTAKAKWEASKGEELSEAEKLAKMSKSERDAYEMKKRLDALEAREKEVSARELKAEAKNTLAEKKLPVALADILDYSDADKCKSSIEAVEKAFNDAVAAAIADKLKGAEPPKKAPKDPKTKKLSEMTYAERLELKTKNPEEYKRLSGR